MITIKKLKDVIRDIQAISRDYGMVTNPTQIELIRNL